MRKVYSLLFVLLALGTSCSDSFDPLEVDQWRLSATFSYMTGTEIPVEDLRFTETIFFEEGGRFVKIRERENENNSAEGVWQEFTRNGESGFLVSYPENTPLVFNCFGTPEEFYVLREGMLIEGSGTPCDGPEYRYLPQE